MAQSLSLFDPVVDPERMNPAFVVLATSPMSEATRRMMDEVFQRMPTKEPHFIEQFQTTGFDQRVWELALFVSLVELGFHVEMPSPAPDFACVSDDEKVFIEATTANAPTVDGKRIAPPRTFEEFREQLEIAVDVDQDAALRRPKDRHPEREAALPPRPLLGGLGRRLPSPYLLTRRTQDRGLPVKQAGLDTMACF